MDNNNIMSETNVEVSITIETVSGQTVHFQPRARKIVYRDEDGHKLKSELYTIRNLTEGAFDVIVDGGPRSVVTRPVSLNLDLRYDKAWIRSLARQEVRESSANLEYYMEKQKVHFWETEKTTTIQEICEKTHILFAHYLLISPLNPPLECEGDNMETAFRPTETNLTFTQFIRHLAYSSTWKLLTILSTTHCPRSIKFSPVGSGHRSLVCADPADYVCIVDAARNFEVGTKLDFFSEIAGFDFRPDGRSIVIANSDDSVGGFMVYDWVPHSGRDWVRWSYGDIRNRAWYEDCIPESAK